MTSPQPEIIRLTGSCAAPPTSSREQHFSVIPSDEEEEALALQDEPETLTAAEKEEKRALKRRIGRFKVCFGTECEDLILDPRSLDALNLEDLRERARETAYHVSTRRSAAATRGMFLGFLLAGETIGPVVGLNLTGLSTVASRSEQLLLCVDECSIAYDSEIAVSPAARLVMAVAQLCLCVSDHNNSLEAGKLSGVVPPVSSPTT